MQLSAGLKATLDLKPSTGHPWFELDLLDKVQVGLTLDLLVWHPHLEATVTERDYPLYKAFGRPPAKQVTISPPVATVKAGTSGQFAAVDQHGKSATVTWTLQGATNGDTISPAGLLTVTDPPYRHLQVTATNSNGFTDTATVTVADSTGSIGIDPPTDFAAAHTGTGTTANLTWTPPGETITGYTITTDPPTTTTTQGAGATSGTLSGLDPNQNYLVSLYAHNAHATSPPATTGLDLDSTPLWVHQLGASQDDSATGVATDPSGNVLITGFTWGTLPGSPEPNAGNDDAFVAKYDPAGNRIWVHQLGTKGYDAAGGVATDAFGNILIAGQTYGTLPGSPDLKAGHGDTFVAKYDPGQPALGPPNRQQRS